MEYSDNNGTVTYIGSVTGPIHVGTGDQIITTTTTSSEEVTTTTVSEGEGGLFINGDNYGGITQSFG